MLFGKYDFHGTLTSDAILPPYKGSTFRGAFGTALKRAVCVTRTRECLSCLLNSRCIYAQTFEAKSLAGAGSHKMATPSVPYVIEPPLDQSVNFRAGSPFDFSLLLFGPANDSLPYFVYAFEIMGASGIGKKIQGQRGGFTLDSVSCGGKIIYDSRTKKLSSQSPVALQHPHAADDTTESSVTVKMLTPLRLKQNNELSAHLPFELLVRAMLRRVSTLFEQFGDGEPPLDYRGLVFRAREVKTVSSALRWLDWERYSNRQEQAMMMGGIMGTVTYHGAIVPYLPLLELCRTLHIGKQSSFGLGLFDYEVLPGEK